MSVNLPNAAKADILTQLAETGDVPGIAAEYGLLDKELIEVATKHGYPRPESMRRAAELLRNGTPMSAKGAPGVSLMGALVVTFAVGGFQLYENLTPRLRMRALSDFAARAMIAGLVGDLGAALAEEHAKTREVEAEKRKREEARAEVARLEKQLREAKARLTGRAAPKLSDNSGTTPGRTDAPPAKEVRAWAKSNGVECPDVGRVPQHVVDKYRDAVAS